MTDQVFYTNCVPHGDSIFMRYIKNGERKEKTFKYEPTLYVPCEEDQVERRTIHGQPVRSLHAGSIKETRDFARSYDGIAGFELYGSDVGFQYQFLNELFGDEEITFDRNLIRVFSIDIETEAENDGFPSVDNPQDRVNVISMHDSLTDQVTIWCLHDDFDEKNLVTDDVKEIFDNHNVVVRKFSENETELLKDFVHHWKMNYPDVITGWNSSMFDIPYLVTRIERLCGQKFAKSMSPINRIHRREVYIKGNTNTRIDIVGVAHLDYLDLYKKFSMKAQESYKLDYIAQVELGKSKVDNPYDTFQEFYQKDYQRFVEYNVIDTTLIRDFENQLGLLMLVFTMAYLARVNYEDVFSPVKTWDMYIYKYLCQNGMVPPLQEIPSKQDYEGGYVMTPDPGFYDWVVSFDLTSLYPSIIMSYNMSPETLMQATPPEIQGTHYDDCLKGKASLEDTGYTIAANDTIYRVDEKGILPTLVEEGFDLRQAAKKKMKEVKNELSEVDKELQKRGLLNKS